jgi:hypothetical protein
MKVVRFSATFTPPRNIPGTLFCKRLSRPQDHSAAGRIMKNSSNTIRNRTRKLPACSAVLQPTHAPYASLICINPRAVVYSTLPLFGFIIIICINYWLLRSAYARFFLGHSHECTASVQTKRKCETPSGMHRIPAFSEVNDIPYLRNPSTEVILRNEQGISAEPRRLWDKFQCRWKVWKVHPH